MARRPDHDMVDVELVDAPEARDEALEQAATWAQLVRESDVSRRPAGRAGAAEPEAGGPKGTRVLRRLLQLVAVTAVVSAVVVGNIAEHQAQERRELAIAAMPGLVGPLAQPLVAGWEHRAGRGSVRAGEVVLAADGAERPPTYRAIDVATGDELWQVLRGPGGVVDWCGGAVEGQGTPMAVCWGDGVVVDPETGASSQGPSTIIGLSLHDGSVVFEREMPVPEAGYGTVDADLVVAHLDSDVLRVRRLDPSTGEERWSAGVPLQVWSDDGTSQASISVVDGFVVVRGPTAAVLSAQDGRELGRWDARPLTLGEAVSDLTGAAITTSDAGFAVWTDRTETSVIARGVWHDRDGREVVEINGGVVDPRASDGSAPGVLLVEESRGTDLQGVDLTDGDVLWSVNLRGGAVVTRRDGAAVVSDGRRLVSVDLRTGNERWSTPLAGLRPEAGSVTDGHHVVVVSARSGVLVLDAVDLETGEVAWSTNAPTSSVLAEFMVPGADSLMLTEIGGHTLAVGQRSVLGLG